jgi:hypothetical protein
MPTLPSGSASLRKPHGPLLSAIACRARAPTTATRFWSRFDLTDIQHKPLVRSPRGHERQVDPVAPLQARIAELEAELAQAEERSRGHRADYERERERADRMVTAHDRLVDDLQAMRSLELAALHSLLQAAEAQKEQQAQAVQPVTTQELAAELETFRFLLNKHLPPVRPVTTRTRRSFDWLPWRWRLLAG